MKKISLLLLLCLFSLSSHAVVVTIEISNAQLIKFENDIYTDISEQVSGEFYFEFDVSQEILQSSSFLDGTVYDDEGNVIGGKEYYFTDFLLSSLGESPFQSIFTPFITNNYSVGEESSFINSRKQDEARFVYLDYSLPPEYQDSTDLSEADHTAFIAGKHQDETWGVDADTQTGQHYSYTRIASPHLLGDEHFPEMGNYLELEEFFDEVLKRETVFDYWESAHFLEFERDAGDTSRFSGADKIMNYKNLQLNADARIVSVDFAVQVTEPFSLTIFILGLAGIIIRTKTSLRK